MFRGKKKKKTPISVDRFLLQPPTSYKYMETAVVLACQ